ncbi:DUF1273 domain-containing protein [Oscillospiraceae bacterium OttesenSCG-928-F05]|nr:DUF1273 domain-containing protein [Oscillospiraceae bacterium OttesenSCG-928-F05]
MAVVFDAPRKNTCCFTGHRRIPKQLLVPCRGYVLHYCRTLFFNEGVYRFISGAATGFDTLAALAICELKRELPEIELLLCLPYRGQASRWSPTDQKAHARLLELADDVTCLSEFYLPECYHMRNRWMVDRAAHVLAYFEGRGGGTAYTLNYAEKQGVHIEIMEP